MTIPYTAIRVSTRPLPSGEVFGSSGPHQIDLLPDKYRARSQVHRGTQVSNIGLRSRAAELVNHFEQERVPSTSHHFSPPGEPCFFTKSRISHASRSLSHRSAQVTGLPEQSNSKTSSYENNSVLCSRWGGSTRREGTHQICLNVIYN